MESEPNPNRIQELLEADQPAARLAGLGANTLSNSELLAILLGGTPGGADATELTRRLVTKFRSMRTLARCDPREFASVEGLSMAQAVALAAAFELGRRVARETIAKLKVDSPEIVCQLLAQDLRALTRESLRALLLDTKYQLLRIEEISLGSLNESIAHPREIFRPALIHSAYAIIMVHNHPSGDPTPSEADRRLTRRVAEVGTLLQVSLLDHIIIGGMQAGQPSYYSFKEAGVLS
jgi:DNA repair protein RadC